MLVEFSDGTRLYVDVTWRKRTPIFLHFPWSGATCNWSPIGTVMLNPERPALPAKESEAKAGSPR